MSRALTVGVLTLLLLSGSARAEETTAALLTKTSQLYADLEFEAALGLLKKAQLRKRNTNAQLIRIYHLRGLTMGALGRYKEASSSFARLLALDPSFRLGMDVAPRVRAPFDALVQKNPPEFSLRLLPPPNAIEAQPLTISVQVTADSLNMARSLEIWFKRGMSTKYASQAIPLKGKGEYRITIPAESWTGQKQSGPLAWYAVAGDENQGELKRFGSDLHPLALDVTKRKEAVPVASVAPASSKPLYGKWWFWVIIGSVAAAGATTAAVLATRNDSGGPYDFTVDFQ